MCFDGPWRLVRIHFSRGILLRSFSSSTAGCAIAKAVTLKGVFDADYTCKPFLVLSVIDRALTIRSGAIYVPALWSVVEVQLAMNIASIPALRPLFSKIQEASRKGSNSGGKTPVLEQNPRPMHMHKAYIEPQIFTLHGRGISRVVDISVNSESDSKYSYDQMPPQRQDHSNV